MTGPGGSDLLEKPNGDLDRTSGDEFLLTRFARGGGFLFARKEYTQTLSLPFNDRHNAAEPYEAVEHTIVDVVHRPVPRGTPVAPGG